MSAVLPIIENEYSPTAKSESNEDQFQWPDSCHVRPFKTEQGNYLLVADGTRIYQLSDVDYRAFESGIEQGDQVISRHLDQLQLRQNKIVGREIPHRPSLYSLSLAVAQKCNLGCTYCYAQQGSFGGSATNMSQETAFKAVERLIEDSVEFGRANIAFLGGEPLLNRPLIRQTTEYAQRLARDRGVSPTFSITTNGTLVNKDDIDFFESFGFSVTVSIDGVGQTHDRLRPNKGGGATFERIMKRVEPLLEAQQKMQVSARVTVTPLNLELPKTLDVLIKAGFHSVGFSPMLASPTGKHEMQETDLGVLLSQMKMCGDRFQQKLIKGERYPFSNMVSAIEQIHRGTSRPFPCGAGAGYMGVGADGELFACHRFVDDPRGHLGNVDRGVDHQQQERWLSQRHVDTQQPCKSCWARYLCGGGCHHEVMHRGRPSCTYVRGWLEYCLKAYTRLKQQCPEYFQTS